jgi:hypothetical protein
MPLKGGKGMVNLGPYLCVSVGKLAVEMDPYRHGPEPWVDTATPIRVAQKQQQQHKGSRVYEVAWSGLVLAEVNIPKGTPEAEVERTLRAAEDLVRMRWGKS